MIICNELQQISILKPDTMITPNINILLIKSAFLS